MSEPVGAVSGLSRFPVKSMQGERLEAAEVTESGFVGDRAYALVETETGKVASAKNPRSARSSWDAEPRSSRRRHRAASHLPCASPFLTEPS